MTEFLLPPGFQATNSDDSPLAGGYYKFFSAGTTTPKAVYSDSGRSVSLGTQVNLNSSGAPVSGSNVPVLIYLGTGAYKVELYDADDTKLYTFDNISGYVEPEEEATTATPVTPVISKTSSYTVTSDDRGKLINANPTGGSFTITMPSAVTVGDNFLVGIRHNGTANAVTLLATGSQNIRFQGNRTAFSLNGQGETLWLVSDGSDWIGCGYVPPSRKDTSPYFIVLDRLTAPPANPDSGARYLMNGTPTGAWSTLSFADKDIAEADGNGSWIRHTPAEGWMAFDVDEKISLVFKDGAWENFQIDPGESTLKSLIVYDQKASGTVGGTATATTWTTSVLNTAAINTITGASLASNEITLPAGRYRVHASKVFVQTEASRIRFRSDDSSIVIYSSVVQAGFLDGTVSNNARAGATAVLIGEFEIASSTDFLLEYYVTNTVDTNDLGLPSSISGFAEIYATVLIEDLAAQQGPKGDQGDAGEGLDAAYAYKFNTATSGDPGSGKILVNNATPASVTQIAVSQTDANGADLTAVIASWDNSTSTTSKARIRWHKEGDPQNFFEFLITAAGTDQGSYWTFPVTYVSHGGTISNNNDIAMLVVQTGDIGSPGTTVPDIDGLTIKTAPSLTDDYSIIYDDAASAHKKYLPFSRDLGLTQIDATSWPQAVGMRIGADLSEDGTASANSANQFGHLIHTFIPSTSSTVGYLKAGIISIAATEDPSTYGPDVWRDCVGGDFRAYALPGNMLARIWGRYAEFNILSGADGYAVGDEIFCINNGTDQPLFDTSTSKVGLHLVAQGSQPTTGAIKLDGTSTFYHGLYAAPDVLETSLWTLDGLATVLVNGSGGFGTVTPDRRLHSEVADAVTNAVTYAARLTHTTSGTAAVNFGVGLEGELENASGTNRVAGRWNTYWADATNAAEYAEWSLDLIKNGAMESSVFKVNSFGTVTAAGSFAVGANQVLGARKTGWTLPTGTAQRSGYTTYTSPNISVGYVEAEVQAIADALQNVSRTLMALIEDCHQTAGHGFIGT